jgi:hypothetical protein
MHADGNYLFRAIIFSVGNNKENCIYLQKKAWEYVSNNWELFSVTFSADITPQNITTEGAIQKLYVKNRVFGTEV